MRQARHLPQRWYWSIVLQVRDVIRQFTQGTPNCNTNPKATVFGIPKEPVLESAELITSRLTGANLQGCGGKCSSSSRSAANINSDSAITLEDSTEQNMNTVALRTTSRHRQPPAYLKDYTRD
ncbi:hypothetical protein TNCV_3677891 [Trichonephila clavipes]|nr:hypothetical protein TNCV_3677891 [Trichonephila clavipes]